MEMTFGELRDKWALIVENRVKEIKEMKQETNLEKAQYEAAVESLKWEFGVVLKLDTLAKFCDGDKI